MRFIFTFFLFIFGLESSSLADCKFDDSRLEQKEFTVRFHNQKVTVLGWYHGIKELEVAIGAVNLALKLGESRKCPEAHAEVTKALEKISNEKLVEGRRVLDRLGSIYQAQKFTLLGLEHSQELYRELFHDPKSKRDRATQILPTFFKHCPKHHAAFLDLALVFPGPELEFVRSKKNAIRVMPLGDEELTQKALSGLSQETRDFSQTIDQLSTEAGSAYEKFGELFLHGQALPAAEIEALVRDLKGAERANIKRYMEDVNANVLQLMDQMNEKILDRALATKKDIVLVIGKAHVPGLRRKFADRCAAQKR